MSRPANANSFDLLRLVAATTVLVCHQFQVLGLPAPMIFSAGGELGVFAVLVFFALSGRLITQSWERQPQAGPFLVKRCLRIFPALLVVVALTALAAGPVLTTLRAGEYFSRAQTWEYFRCAILWPGHAELPGVFATNPYPRAVNAPLWTLSVEFALYLSVLAAGGLGWLRHRHIVSGGVLVLSLLAAIAPASGNAHFMNISTLAAMFWWGAWWLLTVENGRPRHRVDLVIGLVTLALLATVGANSLTRTGQMVFAAGLVWLAAQAPCGERITRRLGDLSYGVYIIAFPVQQALVAALGRDSFSYLEFLAMSGGITFTLAWLSWHLVEKHCIRMKTALLGPASPGKRPARPPA